MMVVRMLACFGMEQELNISVTLQAMWDTSALQPASTLPAMWRYAFFAQPAGLMPAQHHLPSAMKRLQRGHAELSLAAARFRH